MNKSVLRQWAMLRLIPRYPRKTSAPEIHRGLERLGHESTLRTVQRDLNALALTFPLLSDEAKPQGWSWATDAPQLSVPNLDEHAALTFLMAQMHLDQVLPRTTMSYLSPWFKAASQALTSPGRKTNTLNDRIRVISRSLSLTPPKIKAGVLEAVYNALLSERQLRIVYGARIDQKSKTYDVNPIGLVLVDTVCYLVATIGRYTDVRHLAMHRIKDTELLDERCLNTAKVDLDHHIASGAFSLKISDRPIKIRFKMVKQWAFHLIETPIAEDQQYRELDENWVEFSASMNDSQQLRWWVRAFGPDIVILEPKSLRAAIKKEIETSREAYS